ncbi:AraC family transcriptional regulator N-terminal domain-containing protein [Sorangium sp. So ce1153]|uniref:AraC family transcriptional regulator n=1 Tax=Sorangium sp. So ce1153 TaxID=3133333 RepID=UPI003F60945D
MLPTSTARLRHGSKGPHAAGLHRTAPVGERSALIASQAEAEGCTDAAFPGLKFVRVSRPSTCRILHALGPTLTVVGQGRTTARFDDVELEYDASRYAVVAREAAFEEAVTEADSSSPYLAMSLEIPPDAIARMLLALADVSAEPAAEAASALVSDLDTPIEDAVVRLLRAIRDPVERRIVAPLALEELVFRLLRSEAAAMVRGAVRRDRDADKIQAAMRFLRANVERPLSVEEVARHVAMSPSHFAHRFRAVARVSPMRYLKQLRLDHARALLLSGLRGSEAAQRAGYESASHFTRDFKRHFGAAPGDYAARFRKP